MNIPGVVLQLEQSLGSVAGEGLGAQKTFDVTKVFNKKKDNSFSPGKDREIVYCKDVKMHFQNNL